MPLKEKGYQIFNATERLAVAGERGVGVCLFKELVGGGSPD
jgi:hypothetical protein